MTTWHAPESLLARYALDPDGVDDTTASSIEMHLLRCEACQATLAKTADRTDLDSSWAAIADRVDRPRASLLERVAGPYARLVLATPALRLSWLAAVALVVVGVAYAATELDDPGPFLVVAPIVPLAAIAAVFLPGHDTGGEAAIATPLAGFGLALRRSIAVLVPSLAIVAAGSLAVPSVGVADGAWLLPALCLSSAAVALATWVRADVAAVALAAAWVVLVAVLNIRVDAPTRDLLPFTPSGQAASLAIALVAIAVVTARRDEFALVRRPQ